MRAGQAVTIVADVLPNHTFKGHVASLAPATGSRFSILPAENATGNFTKIVQRVPVRIALEGDGAKLDVLRPGLSVIVTVNERALDEHRSGAVRPAKSVDADGEENLCLRQHVRGDVYRPYRHPDCLRLAAGYRRWPVGGRR